MKVQCIRDCFWACRHFQSGGGRKNDGVYEVTLAPGEKLPPHLVEIKAPEPKKASKKADKDIADEL